jgi:hypothetical protein
MSERPGSIILSALMEATLDPESFDHRDHVAAALEALRNFEFFEATQVIGNGLRSLTKKAGAPMKYNATLTFAFMSLIAERMARTPGEQADKFLLLNSDLSDRKIFDRWYSPERVSSNLARRVALLPDKAP